MWLTALNDISPVGIFRTDPDGRCLHVNRRWSEIAGLTQDEAHGDGWASVLHPDDAERVFKVWKQSVIENKPFQAEYRFRTPQGKVTWVMGSATAVRDEKGELLGYIGTITDISQRRSRLERFRKAHEQTRSIIQNMPLLLEAYDEDGLICVWNREAERVTGYGAEEMTGDRDAMERLYPDPLYRASLAELWRKQGGDYENWEWELTAKDGSVHIVSWSNMSGRFPVAGWASWRIGVDVTEHHRMEAALRERLKELNCLYRLSTLCNQPELPLGEFLQRVIDLIPPAWQYPDITCARLAYDGQIYTAGDFQKTEWRQASRITVRGSSGGKLEVFYRERRPELDEGPFLHEERLLIDEIANQVAHYIETRLSSVDQALLDELSAKAEELEQFSYTISHDLKSPLTAIGGFAQFLARQISYGELSKAEFSSRRIAEMVKKMETRIEEILKLAQIGRIADLSGEVAIQDLAFEAVQMLEQNLKDIVVNIALAPDFPPVIGDAERLREVIENLVGNAIKYMGDQPAPEITIGVRTDQNPPVFFVRDNGIGIEPQHAQIVFELFRQLNSDSSGDGTGLAIVKRIVEAHGGQIWVESEGRGKGATFCFTLGGEG